MYTGRSSSLIYESECFITFPICVFIIDAVFIINASFAFAFSRKIIVEFTESSKRIHAIVLFFVRE